MRPGDERREGWVGRGGSALSFVLPDPARGSSPDTDQEPGTGYFENVWIRLCQKRKSSIFRYIIFVFKPSAAFLIFRQTCVTHGSRLYPLRDFLYICYLWEG